MTDQEYKETTISSRKVFEGRVAKLRVDEVRMPDGKTSQREVLDHPGAVAIVPLYADGYVGLIRQFRYAVGHDLLEIPAGTMEPNEEPLRTAMRELEEETGLKAEHYRFLSVFYPSPGVSSERLWVYLAEGLQSGESHTEEDEHIQQVKLSLKNALKLIVDGEICDSKSIIGLLLTRDYLQTKDNCASALGNGPFF